MSFDNISKILKVQDDLSGAVQELVIKNSELQKDLASGFFLLIFLTAKLSKFDVIPNYWAPLKFWDWNTLFSIPRVEAQKFDIKEIIGEEFIDG